MTSVVVRVVCRALGMESQRARPLVTAMRARRPALDYWARFGLFAVAVSPLGRLLGARRRRAIAPFVFKLLDRPAEAMYFVGATGELAHDGPRGMLAE